MITKSRLRRHLLSSVSGCVLALGAASQGSAADLAYKTPSPIAPVEARNWYVEFEGGVAVLTPRSADPGLIYGIGSPPYFSELGTDTGAVAGARLGYQFNPWFRADLSFHYMGWTVSGRYLCGPGVNGCNNLGQTPSNNTLNAARSAHSFVEMVNGYIDFDPFIGGRMGRFHPYITAGVGAAQNHLDANCVSCDYGAGNGSNTHNSLAWDAGVGTRIDLFQDVKLDIAYRYYDLGKFIGGFNAQQFIGRFNGPTGGDSFKPIVHTVTAGVVVLF